MSHPHYNRNGGQGGNRTHHQDGQRPHHPQHHRHHHGGSENPLEKILGSLGGFGGFDQNPGFGQNGRESGFGDSGAGSGIFQQICAAFQDLVGGIEGEFDNKSPQSHHTKAPPRHRR